MHANTSHIVWQQYSVNTALCHVTTPMIRVVIKGIVDMAKRRHRIVKQRYSELSASLQSLDHGVGDRMNDTGKELETHEKSCFQTQFMGVGIQ